MKQKHQERMHQGRNRVLEGRGEIDRKTERESDRARQRERERETHMQRERDRRKREKCKVGEEEACIMQYNK